MVNNGYMGLSENSVPLHPLVLLIIIPIKWLFHWEYTPFSDIPMFGIVILKDVQSIDFLRKVDWSIQEMYIPFKI